MAAVALGETDERSTWTSWATFRVFKGGSAGVFQLGVLCFGYVFRRLSDLYPHAQGPAAFDEGGLLRLRGLEWAVAALSLIPSFFRPD